MLTISLDQMQKLDQSVFFGRIKRFIFEQTDSASLRKALGEPGWMESVCGPHWPDLEKTNEHDAALVLTFLMACATEDISAKRAIQSVVERPNSELIMKKFLSDRGFMRFSDFDFVSESFE